MHSGYTLLLSTVQLALTSFARNVTVRVGSHVAAEAVARSSNSSLFACTVFLPFILGLWLVYIFCYLHSLIF